MNLISAAMFAPWCAVDPDDKTTVHALEVEQVVKGWDAQRFLSPCGIEVKLLPVYADDGEHEGWACLGWPPRVSTLNPGVRRCKQCHELTGKKRPADRAMLDPSYEPKRKRQVETVKTELV